MMRRLHEWSAISVGMKLSDRMAVVPGKYIRMSDNMIEDVLAKSSPSSKEVLIDPATPGHDKDTALRTTTFAVVITSYNYRDYVLEAVEQTARSHCSVASTAASSALSSAA